MRPLTHLISVLAALAIGAVPVVANAQKKGGGNGGGGGTTPTYSVPLLVDATGKVVGRAISFGVILDVDGVAVPLRLVNYSTPGGTPSAGGGWWVNPVYYEQPNCEGMPYFIGYASGYGSDFIAGVGVGPDGSPQVLLGDGFDQLTSPVQFLSKRDSFSSPPGACMQSTEMSVGGMYRAISILPASQFGTPPFVVK